jgi:hypothetical protein
MFRSGQIAHLENRLQHFTRLIAYEDGQYRRRIPHYTHGAAQHGARVIDIFQKVMAKNDIERSRLKNVRQLGGVTAFNRDLVTYSGFDHRPFRQSQHRRRRIEQGDMNTETRQTNGGSSCSAPDIEGAQRVDSRRCGQKFLQVRKSQACA